MIKTLSRIFAVVAVVLGISAATQAVTSFTFQPNPVDLNDLDHYYAYKWGMQLNVPADQRIICATLSFKNIRDWTNESNTLWADLLNTTKMGVHSYYDDQGDTDYFAGKGVNLFKWVNLPTTPQNLSYDFDTNELAALAVYIADDGKFGIGLDPDCHFFNDGITLTIKTDTIPREQNAPPPVPEPCTMVLGGIAAAGLVTSLTRRRARAE